MLAGLCKVAEFYLILHVVDLLLCWVVAHCSHKVRELVKGNCAVEAACLGSVLIFAADHRVVEEVLHILVGLAIATTLNQIDKGLDTLTTKSDSLVNWGHIDRPHIHSEILSTASE